jgi:hypothetical protein
VFTLQAFSVGSYQRLTTFLLRSNSQKQASWSLSFGKQTKSPKQIFYKTTIGTPT